MRGPSGSRRTSAPLGNIDPGAGIAPAAKQAVDRLAIVKTDVALDLAVTRLLRWRRAPSYIDASLDNVRCPIQKSF